MRQPCQWDSAVAGPFLRAAYPSAKREQYVHKLMLFQRRAFPDIFDLFECFAQGSGARFRNHEAQNARRPSRRCSAGSGTRRSGSRTSRAGPSRSRCSGEKIVLLLDENGEPAACRTAAAIARRNSPRAGATTANSSAAITAGPTTATARWCASRSLRPTRWCRGSACGPITARSATAMPGSASRSRWRRSRTCPRTASRASAASSSSTRSGRPRRCA